VERKKKRKEKKISEQSASPRAEITETQLAGVSFASLLHEDLRLGLRGPIGTSLILKYTILAFNESHCRGKPAPSII
jgi:hypothetical protein